MKLRAATRGSPLAMWQTNHIATLLEKHGYQVEPIIVETVGDKDQVSPLHKIGGQGIFVKEVQSFVIQGRADFAVHSLKDLPSDTPSELVLAAVPDRGDPRDARSPREWEGRRGGALACPEQGGSEGRSPPRNA